MKELPEKIARRIDTNDPDGCWIWTGGKHTAGYGMAYYRKRSWFAHRLVYSLLIGRPPRGKQLHHICKVRLCVNPEHLAPVTGAEHVRLEGNGAKTHCKHGHEFTPENTYRWRTERRCRTCMAAASARSYAKRNRLDNSRYNR